MQLSDLHCATGHEQLFNGRKAFRGAGQVGGHGQLAGLIPAEHVEIVELRDHGAVPATGCNLQGKR